MVSIIMIDKLVLRCDFKKVQHPMCSHSEKIWPSFQLADLGIPLEQSIDRNGNVTNIRHPWESIPSSFESMAFKVFDNRYDGLDMFCIEIKASPAKLMLGHNIFGSSDFYDCSQTLIELLCETYPDLTSLLDWESWDLNLIDVTYSTRAKDTYESKAFINALHCVSFGQTKSRTGYDGTAYFGKKNSRLKKIKVYSKAPEVQETIKKNQKHEDAEEKNAAYTIAVLAFAEGLIRWEVSLMHRYFERMGLTTKLKDIYQQNTFSSEKLQGYWQNATNDLFNSLKGQTMKTLNNQEIKQQLRAKFSKTSVKTGKVSTVLADSVFRTYNDICRDGWMVTRDSMSIANFNKHVKMLTDCGMSRAALQNMNGLNDGAQIIPFVRFIEVDFCNQFPDWYEQPAPKHVYQKPQLRLVA
jgi:II/X family phage/plasmid replication protein